MDIIKASLMAAVCGGGGGSTTTVMDEICALPTLQSGTIAGTFTYAIKFGAVSPFPKVIQTQRVVLSGGTPFTYTQYELDNLKTFVVIYNGSTPVFAWQNENISPSWHYIGKQYSYWNNGDGTVDIYKCYEWTCDGFTYPAFTVNLRAYDIPGFELTTDGSSDNKIYMTYTETRYNHDGSIADTRTSTDFKNTYGYSFYTGIAVFTNTLGDRVFTNLSTSQYEQQMIALADAICTS